MRPALPSYLKVWITAPTPLSEGLDPPLTLIHVKCVFLNNTRCCLHDLQLQLKYLSFSDLQSTFSKEYTFGTCAMCPSHSDVGLIKSSLKGVKKGGNHSWSVVRDGSRGGAYGALLSLIFRPNRGLKGRKNNFQTGPPYLRVFLTAPPPHPPPPPKRDLTKKGLRVLPDPNFRSILLLFLASRVCPEHIFNLKSRPHFALKSRIPTFKKAIPHPEKSTGDPRGR